VTIRIYPSRLEGEPLETHQHASTTIAEWFACIVQGWKSDMAHPVAVDMNGVSIPTGEWGTKIIDPDDDVRISRSVWTCCSCLAGMDCGSRRAL
jgi:sulfur carrier protein ThiS